MVTAEKYEFRCPFCGSTNSVTQREHNALREQSINCSSCYNLLSVTAAAGVNNSINIVVFEDYDLGIER